MPVFFQCPYGYYSDLTGGTFCNVCASGSIVDKEVGATICEVTDYNDQFHA